MDTQAPARLQSDNGKEFTALIILELCKAFGVKLVNGSIGHPQSQGAVERCNRTIKDKISAQLMLSPTIEWSYQVHPACFVPFCQLRCCCCPRAVACSDALACVAGLCRCVFWYRAAATLCGCCHLGEG